MPTAATFWGVPLQALKYRRMSWVLRPDLDPLLKEPDQSALGKRICNVSVFEATDPGSRQDGWSCARIEDSKAEHHLPRPRPASMSQNVPPWA